MSAYSLSVDSQAERKMPDFNFVLFYVADPAASVAFYSALLGREPVERSDNFAAFAMPSGLTLGLWRQKTAVPKLVAPAGSAEIGFGVADNADVQKTHDDWKARGIAIAQPPTQMDFGFTFVALDPDQYRLRVFGPPA